MTFALGIFVLVEALGACHQDESASNSERDTHMGDVHAAEPAEVRPTGSASAASANPLNGPAAAPASGPATPHPAASAPP